MGKFINRVGKRYGRLVVESLSRKVRRVGTGEYDYYWNCICDCGNRIEVLGKSLSCKNRESCGCLHRERISKSRKGNPVKYKHIPLFDSEKEALDYIYKITEDGRVFSRCDWKELTVVNGPKGYKYIRLKNPQFSKNKDGRKSYKVHRLVAMFYLKQYSEKLFVNHKNGDKADNRVQNLEMVRQAKLDMNLWDERSPL